MSRHATRQSRPYPALHARRVDGARSGREGWSPPVHAADLPKLRALFEDDPSAVVSFITTEHFTLQTARANTSNEANGRATIYLMSVSSAIVALAFIGQIAELGTPFFAFAFVLLPPCSSSASLRSIASFSPRSRTAYWRCASIAFAASIWTSAQDSPPT
jgi:hypothetical protein